MNFESQKIITLVFVAFLLLNACSKKKVNPIAKAYGNILTFEEIENKLAPDLNAEDSLRQLNEMVNLWILDQVKINAAKKSYTEQNNIIERKVEDYKNDLLVYYYEANKLQDELDTVISINEMRSFYEKNKSNFLLGKDIVKLIFVKIKNDPKLVNLFTPLVKSPEENNRIKLMEMTMKYATNSFLDDQLWLNFDDIQKEIPISTPNIKNFLQNNNYFEIEEGDYIYLVNILNYQIKNSLSEFEFEKENIKKVILQNRKMAYLKQLNIELLKEAELNKDWESFLN